MNYWFTTQYPPIHDGIAVRPRFRNSANKIEVGDRIAIYEVYKNTDDNKYRDSKGAKAIVALAEITRIVNVMEGRWLKVAEIRTIAKRGRCPLIKAQQIIKEIEAGNAGFFISKCGGKAIQISPEEFDEIGSYFEDYMTDAKTEHQGKFKTAEEAEADKIESLIRNNKDITETEKEALVKARKGQGKFRDDVLRLHGKCPFTGVSNPIFLTAGHLKPWSKCDDNQERLDPLNGLPLTPVADQLVDQGFVTFDDIGVAVFSNQLEVGELKTLGISLDKKYQITIFDPRQLKYLKYHRDKVFKKIL